MGVNPGLKSETWGTRPTEAPGEGTHPGQPGNTRRLHPSGRPDFQSSHARASTQSGPPFAACVPPTNAHRDRASFGRRRYVGPHPIVKEIDRIYCPPKVIQGWIHGEGFR